MGFRLFLIFIGGCICVGQVYGKDAFQWKGDLLLDQDHYGPVYQKDQSKTKYVSEVRRLKLGMNYQVMKQLKTELDLEVSEQEKRDDGFEVKDAWIRWQGNQSAFSWTIGHFKEPMGHERLSSTGRLPLIERSMVSSAFAPGRSLGVSMLMKGQAYTFASGVFQGEPEEEQIDQNDVWAWTTRMTQAWNKESNTLHIGGALSYRDLNDTLFQLEERGEVNSADNFIQGARFYADRQLTSQLEVGYAVNRMWLMAEYFSSQVSAADGKDWFYDGFYVQLVYGSEQKYKGGRFKSPVKAGQWEAVVRYSGLNLRDHNLGAEAGSLVMGMNYHISKKMTVMLNHLRPTVSGNVVNSDLSGNATSARVKFRF